MKIPRPKLDVIELTLLGVLVAVLGYFGGQFRTVARLAPFLTHSAGELQSFQDRYGPGRNSEHGEEWIIRDFFQDQRGGIFVDVGANDPQRFSNTFYLETVLGWSGLAVEPQAKFSEAYRTLRPRTTLIPLFVSDVSNREAVLHVPRNNDLIASSSKTFVEEEGGTDIQPVHTNTTTLDDLLERSGISRIDFLSIDIELHEPAALAGFSIDRYRPRLVAVEGHLEVRQQILDYFAAHDYILLGKYLRADAENMWFAPRSSGGAPKF
jgi:FkbM family methyltransferase